MEKVTSALTVISEWVMNLFLLHLYWIGGTLLGGVVFGIVPATIALLSTIRQLVLKRDMIDLFKYYKSRILLCDSCLKSSKGFPAIKGCSEHTY